MPKAPHAASIHAAGVVHLPGKKCYVSAPNGVVSAKPDPLWDGAVLLCLLRQLHLDAEGLLRRLQQNKYDNLSGELNMSSTAPDSDADCMALRQQHFVLAVGSRLDRM
jgi:hypothetical protein